MVTVHKEPETVVWSEVVLSSGFSKRFRPALSQDKIRPVAARGSEGIRLTQLSHGSGCGCKLSPTELESVLAQAFPAGRVPETFAGLVIGNETRDDAAVYDIGGDELLIATTDFFTPIVDDAYQYGRIAAANALSDVWAMGGRPILALAILGWPVEELDPALAAPIVAGGRDLCRQVGIPLAGGHSIDSKEPFFGLAVNGLVSRERLRTNAGAREGDLVFLTKPLGTGLLSTAEKYGILRPQDEGLGARIMARLNDVGYDLAGLEEVHAVTDVTGFGLLGHLVEMCEAAGLQADLDWGALPMPTDLARYVAAGALAKGLKNNWRSYGDKVSVLKEPVRSILCDPQTGGGLLVAAGEKGADRVCRVLEAHGLEEHLEPIARLVAAKSGRPVIRVSGHESVPEIRSFFGLDAAAKNQEGQSSASADSASDQDGTAVESEPARKRGHAPVPSFNASCAPPRPAEAGPAEMLKMMRVFFGDLVRNRRRVAEHGKWIREFARKKGYRVNPHWMMYTNLRLWLVEAEDTFGRRYCPCFEPSDDEELNRALICPCRFMEQDIEEKGTCHCGLFGRHDLTDDEFMASEERIIREYRVELKWRGDMVDTTSIPTDPFRGLKIPDAYHLAKRALLTQGAPVDIFVERDFEAENLRAWGRYKGISVTVRPEGDGYRVTLGR